MQDADGAPPRPSFVANLYKTSPASLGLWGDKETSPGAVITLTTRRVTTVLVCATFTGPDKAPTSVDTPSFAGLFTFM